jgi:HlyD family secretion protein
VTATGRIQPVTQVKVSADVSARITRLEVEEGDWVEKGELLLELDRERTRAEVERAEANLRSAEAQAAVVEENLDKASKDHARIRDLFGKNLESQANLDAASAAEQVDKARLRSANDDVAQSRAALKQARDALAKTTIYAPMAGTVSRLNKEVGEIALGSQFQADVILEISNLAGMEALVDVD